MADRQRSLWAWGWTDRFPDETARKGMVAMVGALVPGVQPAVRPLPPDEPAVPPSPVRIPDALAAFTSQAPRERAQRTRGRGFPDLVAGFSGDFGAAPDVIARPRSHDEVVQTLEVANARGWIVIPFGGGTSVVQGVDAKAARSHGGFTSHHIPVCSLDLGALSGVYEVDATSRLARIGGGTLGPRLEDELGPHGLTLRHFPQSFEFSTLGGWLATRAGGHYATGPTHIDDHCHALTMVSPRGAIATHRHPASGAGPEAARFLIGSEGAFGVITEAWMRLVPKPRWRASASVTYPTFASGAEAARALVQSGLQPANCRLLDPNEAKLHRVRFDGTAVLLIGFESADHPMTPWLTRALELAKDLGGTVVSGPTEKDDAGKSGDAGAWRQAFFDAPYLQSALLSLGVISDTFETACTWTQFPALDAAVRSAVQGALDRECGGGIIACRFTHVYPDGPAPYYTFVGGAKLGSELAQWRAIKEAASDALAAAGGTITHHHAVGRLHRPWHERERPALFGEALGELKRLWDPRGIMNPGVLVR